MYGYYTKSQKGSEKEGLITAISFICDSISNILFGNLGECIWHTSTTTYYNTKKIVRIITFSSYCSHTNILFKHLNVLPFKKLLFLRIGLQMFKYEYGQLPDALNMFLLRIDLCIITILETRTNSALLLLSIYSIQRHRLSTCWCPCLELYM